MELSQGQWITLSPADPICRHCNRMIQSKQYFHLCSSVPQSPLRCAAKVNEFPGQSQHRILALLNPLMMMLIECRTGQIHLTQPQPYAHRKFASRCHLTLTIISMSYQMKRSLFCHCEFTGIKKSQELN